MDRSSAFPHFGQKNKLCLVWESPWFLKLSSWFKIFVFDGYISVTHPAGGCTAVHFFRAWARLARGVLLAESVWDLWWWCNFKSTWRDDEITKTSLSLAFWSILNMLQSILLESQKDESLWLVKSNVYLDRYVFGWGSPKPSKLSPRRSLAAQGGGKLRVGLCLTLILAVRVWNTVQFLRVEGSLKDMQDFGEVSQQRGNIYKGT